MSRRRRALALALAGLCLPAGTSGDTGPRPLRPGEAVERPLAGGEEHLYELSVDAGTWRVAAEQQGIDLVLTLDGSADGCGPVSVNDPLGRQGTELLLFTTPVGVSCRLAVEAAARLVAPGSYRLLVAAVEADTHEQRRRLAAETAMTTAAELHRAGSADDRRRAMAEYRRAKEIWGELGDRGGLAKSLYSLAAIARGLGDLREALDLHHQALALWTSLGDRSMQALSLNELGLLYLNLGEPDRAVPLLERAIGLWRAVGNRFGEAVSRSNICFAKDRPEQARPCLEEVLRLHREAGEAREEAVALINLGREHFRMGEPRAALESLDEARAKMSAAGGEDLEALALNNIAFLYRRLGRLQEALDYFGRALDVFERTGDKRRQAMTHNNRGRAYLGLGDLTRARSVFEHGLELRREIGDPRGEAITLKNLGSVHQGLGDPGQALALHGRALALSRQVEDRRLEGEVLYLIARGHAARGEPKQALELFDRALSLQRQTGDRGGEAWTLLHRGSLRNTLVEHEVALESLRQSLALFRGLGRREGEAQALFEIARAQRGLGRHDEALETVQGALEIVESLRESVESPDLRASLLDARRDVYELQIELLMTLDAARPAAGYALRALEASERSRARSLLDLLARAGADLYSGVDPELLAKREDLQLRLNARARQRLDLLARRPGDEEAAAVEHELFQTLAELEGLEADLRRRSPRAASLTGAPVLAAAEIQGLLTADELLLELALGNERSFLWAVGPESVSWFELPAREQIEQLAAGVHEAFSRRGSGDAARLQAAKLSRLVLAPVAKLMAGRRLIVVADGALHYVPFAALPAPRESDGEGAPLLERHEVVHLPSATALATLRRQAARRPAAPRLLAILADPVFGPDDPRVRPSAGAPDAPAADRPARRAGLERLERLPASRREAQALAALVPPDDARIALDFEASRDTLLDPRLRDFRLLHLATHGAIEAQRPALSGLILSTVDQAGRPREGFVGLHDLYGLELGADLVVLSGCQTALGRELKGEGLVGLTRGFMYAGVPRVVASLWQVEDRATAELMGVFYRAMLVDGLTPAAALRAAQRELRAQPRWADPYYWAAFVLQGEWR